MSTTSMLSQVSVGYNGELVNVEQALDSVIRDLQQHLNDLQMRLRNIAMASDQMVGDTGDMEDLKNSVIESDQLEDHILEMVSLFTDLKEMAGDLAYLPETAEERAWLKQHKVERKAQLAQKKIDETARRKANRAKIDEQKS